MPEQDLDGPHVRAGLQQVGGEAVAQGVHSDMLARAPRPPGRACRPICTVRGMIGRSGQRPGKSYWLGPVRPSSTGGGWPESGREHHVAVLLPLGLADADDHPPAVDVVDSEADDLREPQPGGIGGHEDGAVLEVWDGR